MSKDTTKDYLYDQINSLQESVKDTNQSVAKLDKTLAEYKVAFDHHAKTDEDMYSELRRMNDILAKNTESLNDHMHRTELNEQATELLKQAVFKMSERLTAVEVKEIKEQAVSEWLKNKAWLATKICAALAGLGSFLMVLPTILRWLITFIQ